MLNSTLKIIFSNSKVLSLFTLTILFGLSSCTHNIKNNESWKTSRQPAEFEKVDAVWLMWPSLDHKKGKPVQEVTLSIIDALVKDLKVVVTCGNEQNYKDAKIILNKRFKKNKNLTITKIPSYQIWTRDMGPVFVETNDGRLAIADFNFNSWGYSDTLDIETKTEEMFDVRVAKLLQLPVVSSAMISESGNREVNGKGTLLVTESVEQGRNPKMSKAEMEAEYKRLLGVKKTIWLKQGLQEDDHTFLGPINTINGGKAYTVVTTNGHIDEFARFVNDSTIVLAHINSSEFNDPIALENYKRMEENYKILKESTDQDGNSFNIVRMPLPNTVLSQMSPGDPVYDYIQDFDYLDGSIFPKGDSITVVAAASYLNFLITNKVVIGQKYWKVGMSEEVKIKDVEAKNVLQSLFPKRKIILLDALAVNLGGGGIHCITMQQPKLTK